MGILDFFRRRKITLQDVRLERARLERREKQLAGEIEALAREKQDLFQKGAQVGTRQLRTIYARRFEEATRRLSDRERECVRTWKELRVLSALQRALERSPQAGKEGRLLSRLTESQMAEILRMVESDNVNEEVLQERLDVALGLLDETQKEPEIGTEGQELLQIWEKMDEGQLDAEEGLRTATEHVQKKKEPREPG